MAITDFAAEDDVGFCLDLEGGLSHETENRFGIRSHSNRFCHGCLGPSQHRAGDGTGVGRHDILGVAASLVIAEILLSGYDRDFGSSWAGV